MFLKLVTCASCTGVPWGELWGSTPHWKFSIFWNCVCAQEYCSCTS